jgi:hypothetical protein
MIFEIAKFCDLVFTSWDSKQGFTVFEKSLQILFRLTKKYIIFQRHEMKKYNNLEFFIFFIYLIICKSLIKEKKRSLY